MRKLYSRESSSEKQSLKSESDQSFKVVKAVYGNEPLQLSNAKKSADWVKTGWKSCRK